MTHLIQRTALILLAGTALTACGTPRYAVNAPVIQVPPPAVPAAAPPQQLAAAQDAPADFAHPTPKVESRELAPLPSAPRPALAQASRESPVLAFAPPAEDAAARVRGSAPATYKVKSGDTLAEIADRLGTTIADLAEANGLKKPYRLQPGQVLKNPKAPKASSARSSRSSGSGGATYTVRPGDTLFGIAQRNGTTVQALREANGLGASSSIVPGRKLKLPGGEAEGADDEPAPVERPEPRSRRPQAEAPPAEVVELEGRTITNREVTGRVVEISIPGKSYKVKSGDNLERIAGRLDSDVDELAKINKLKKPYRIQPGQTIRGPGSTAKAYVVGRGDTLSEIARRFSVTEAELRSANGLRRGASVAPGRRLRLPAGYRDRGPLTTTTRVPDRVAPTPAPPPPEPTPALPSSPRPYEGTARPPSSFDTPPPVGQTLPPPRSAPRPPTVVMPGQSQPYRPPPGGVPGAPVASPPVSDAQISQMGRGLFAWPLQGQVLSGFGGRGGGVRNDGLNIRASTGDPVRAAAAGDVVYAGDQVPGFGNLVLIKHADGWVTAYGHLSRVEVRMQQKVEQGQQIGLAGSSGGVSEPQLHFEIRYAPTPQERARPVDPTLVLPPR